MRFQHESDFSIHDLALYLALLKWRRTRQLKIGASYEPSKRALARWLREAAIPATEALIIEAAKELRGTADSDFERLIRVWMLQRIHSARRVRRGRPKKAMSLMEQARARVESKRGPGRPSHSSPVAEAQWVAYITGLKLRLYTEGGDGERSPVASAIDRLRRAARSDQTTPLNQLDREISDLRVLRDPSAKALSGSVPLQTLRKRLQRARQRHQFVPAVLKPQD